MWRFCFADPANLCIDVYLQAGGEHGKEHSADAEMIVVCHPFGEFKEFQRKDGLIIKHLDYLAIFIALGAHFFAAKPHHGLGFQGDDDARAKRELVLAGIAEIFLDSKREIDLVIMHIFNIREREFLSIAKLSV